MAMEKLSSLSQRVRFITEGVLTDLDIEKTSSLPQELPDGAEGDATQKANREERKENVQIKEAEPISNIVHVKLNWGGDVYLEVRNQPRYFKPNQQQKGKIFEQKNKVEYKDILRIQKED